MNGFEDHFSKQSKTYSKYRPEYPDDLFKFLSRQCPEHNLAWDCATGNGQAARGLSSYFDNIVATDASENQIINASGPSNIKYSVADASNSGLEDNSVDLITVAQALHWFDLEAFYKEVRRVLKPQGKLAIWCYGILEIDEDINPLFLEFYHKVVGPYWPKERMYVENRYSSLDLPLNKVINPDFQLNTKLSLDDFLGYLRTWSATARYIEDNGEDPVTLWQEKFSNVWGNNPTKTIFWPVTVFEGHI